jgi:hypothetical protein
MQEKRRRPDARSDPRERVGVSYLRHKSDVVDPPLPSTVRGVGYRFRLPPDRPKTGTGARD